jgi:hypothetical protein
MPLTKLQLRPGITRETTNYAAEGSYYSCDKIRFRYGFPEKIGGWTNYSPGNSFAGVSRSLFNWATYTNANLLALGTNQKYYVEYGGVYNDITPLRATATLGTDPIETVSGSLLATITHAGHGTEAGSFVTFSGATAVGGLTIEGEYEVIAVLTPNTYTIASPTAASSAATGGGAAVVAAYLLSAGNPTFTTAGGWGAGPWGRGTWGSDYVLGGVASQLRLWSQDNHEEDLVFAPRGGSLYYWTADVSTFTRGRLLSAVANETEKFRTTATSGGAGTTITVADASFINVGSVVISGTNIATPGTDYVTAISGNTVTLSAATSGAASGVYVFSYAGRYVPNTVSYVLSSDTSGFTITLGSTRYDPTTFTQTFDPMLVRWSDQSRPWEFVPETTNQSGEVDLSNGSYLVCGIDTQQEILVWSDTALFSMQYVGPPYTFSFSLRADNISIAGPNAVAAANGVSYWMGADKFYTYAGQVQTLPCSVRKFVFNDFNANQLFQVVAGTNEAFNEVWWFYPSATSNINNRYVAYNYLDNVWTYGTLNRTAWLDSGLRSNPMAVFSLQASFLDADLTADATSFALVNAASYPTSGTVTIEDEDIAYTMIIGNTVSGCTRGVNGTTAATHLAYRPVTYRVPNQVLFHESGVDDRELPTAAPINAFIESNDFDIADGHQFGFVTRILPDVSFEGSTANNPAVTMTVRARGNSGRPYTTDGVPTVARTSTSPIEQYTGEVFVRIRGRQMTLKIESTALGVAWQLGAARIDVRPDGRS